MPFCGFSTQWVSSGKKRNLLGTPSICAAVECRHSLGVGNAEIVAAMNDKYGRIPLLNKFVGALFEALHGNSVVGFPGCPAHFPLVEEHLLGGEVLHLGVKNSAMGNECLKALVVVTSQPEYGVATIAGTYGPQAVFVNPGFFFHLIDGSQKVFHLLPAMVFADLVSPLLTKGQRSATAGCHHHVAIGAMMESSADTQNWLSGLCGPPRSRATRALLLSKLGGRLPMYTIFPSVDLTHRRSTVGMPLIENVLLMNDICPRHP